MRKLSLARIQYLPVAAISAAVAVDRRRGCEGVTSRHEIGRVAGIVSRRRLRQDRVRRNSRNRRCHTRRRRHLSTGTSAE